MVDQGIVQNFKMYYRKRILQKIIVGLENGEALDNVVNLRVAIAEMSEVWQYEISR